MGKAEKKDPTLTLAELAHELRQPLTGIRTSAELLLESHGDDPAVRTRAAAIVQQVQRIQLLIERARRSRRPGRFSSAMPRAKAPYWSAISRRRSRESASIKSRWSRSWSTSCATRSRRWPASAAASAYPPRRSRERWK